VDWVRAKGKRHGLLLHELVGEPGAVADETLAAIQQYADALDAYRDREFEQALAGFGGARRAFGGRDGPSEVMSDRCQQFLETPPPSDWDGVFHVAAK